MDCVFSLGAVVVEGPKRQQTQAHSVLACGRLTELIGVRDLDRSPLTSRIFDEDMINSGKSMSSFQYYH